MNKNKGFIGIGLIVAIVLGAVIIAGGAYYLGINENEKVVENPIVENENKITDNLLADKDENKNTEVTDNKKEINFTEVSTTNWKTYTNTDYGFSFDYPSTWTKNREESNAINRNGEVMSISVNFIDTISNSNFYLAYHLAPYGAEVYKLAEEDYISSKNSNERDTKQISISGNNAVETFTTMSKDIKGNIYNPALKLIHIVFLDKQKTGGFNLNFRTPAPDSEKEIAKFNKLLTTFKFL